MPARGHHRLGPGDGWRGDTSIDKRIEYDLYYLQNWSFAFDLRIIAMTILSGLMHRNAY